MQGLLVVQDSSNFIRFDVYSYGSSVGVYAAHFANGAVNTVLNKVISKGASYYLRINRQANNWVIGLFV